MNFLGISASLESLRREFEVDRPMLIGLPHSRWLILATIRSSLNSLCYSFEALRMLEEDPSTESSPLKKGD